MNVLRINVHANRSLRTVDRHASAGADDENGLGPARAIMTSVGLSVAVYAIIGIAVCVLLF
jgi:hypothetical protein